MTTGTTTGAALGTITDELSAHVVVYVWNGRMYGTALPGYSSCHQTVYCCPGCEAGTKDDPGLWV